MERCEGCGFAWETVPAGQVGARIEVGVDEIADLVSEAADAGVATTRPEPTTWSVLEYAAHVRDVMLNVRDRLVIAAVEDDPTFKLLYRDERVDLGLYARDTPTIVLAELPIAAGLFDRTFRAFDAEQLAKTAEYAYPVVARRSVLWMGQQVVHEIEHHRADIAAVLEALRV